MIENSECLFESILVFIVDGLHPGMAMGKKGRGISTGGKQGGHDGSMGWGCNLRM